jgi:hypothetical protein
MLPPVNAGKVDSTAPLSKWMQLRAFDWASDCDREKWQRVAERTIAALDKSKTNNERTKARITGGQYFESRCIATDDPRLKEK